MAIKQEFPEPEVQSIRHRPGAQARLKAELYMTMAERALATSSDIEEIALAEQIIQDVGAYMRKEMNEKDFMSLTHDINLFNQPKEATMSKQKQTIHTNTIKTQQAQGTNMPNENTNAQEANAGEQVQDIVQNIVDEQEAKAAAATAKVKEAAETTADSVINAAEDMAKAAQDKTQEAVDSAKRMADNLKQTQAASEAKSFFEKTKDTAQAIWDGETLGLQNKYLIMGAAAVAVASGVAAYYINNQEAPQA